MKEISSLEHPLVKYWVRLKRSSDFRHEHKRVLFEGKNAIKDIAKHTPIRRLITTAMIAPFEAEEVYNVTPAVLKKISDVETSDGIIAEFDISEIILQKPLSRLLVLDRIQDPGNMGTLIRSAFALGWQAIFFLPGCCDPYNDKALRSAKGATFFIPQIFGTWQELTALSHKQGLTIFIADMDGCDVELVPSQNMALVLGNEGQGVEVPAAIVHERVKIQMAHAFDSLNVAQAGAILMYCLRGKR